MGVLERSIIFYCHKYRQNTAFLFVDDDPRWLFHNFETERYFLSAAEVLDEGGASDAFVREVARRPFDRIHAQGRAEEFSVATAGTGLVEPCSVGEAEQLASRSGWPYSIRGAREA